MSRKGKTPKQLAKEIFSVKNITRMAVFTALAYLLYMPIFEFSLIPAVPFLKVDFSNAFVMIAGFALGSVPALIVGVLKELLHALTFSQTVGVGELANIIIMLPYIIIPSIMYKRRRTIKTVFLSLAIGVVAQSLWSIPVNYVLTFPFFLMAYAGAPDWTTGMNFYLDVWYWAVLFNFVKTLLVSAAVLLLYKQFQRLFAYIFKDRKKDAAKAVAAAPDSNVDAVKNVGSNDFDDGTKYEIATPEEMDRLGFDIGKSLVGGEVILLSGELGAGKTVFCKGLARGAGFGGSVVSPTFTLMNEYKGGRLDVYHIDAYRLASAEEAEASGLGDYIGKSDGICAVEWWENIADMFDGMATIKISIVKTDDGRSREVTVRR